VDLESTLGFSWFAPSRAKLQRKITRARGKTRKTLAKKREELARVLDRLRSPGPSPGMPRELRKQQALLEEEIADIDGGN
jgi:hypothetical protein